MNYLVIFVHWSHSLQSSADILFVYSSHDAFIISWQVPGFWKTM